MKFQAEIDLVEALKSTIKSFYNRNYVRVFEEVSLGYGIADIVISDLKAYKSEPTNSEFILNHNDVNVLDFIQKKGTSSSKDIIDITRCSKLSVKRSLNKLLDRGYLIEHEGSFEVSNDYELPFRNNYAIEAKLKDWKRALKQAYRYRWFAEYSFVVLDSHHSSAALKNLDVFEKYNVGLASISTDGVLHRHYNPKRMPPFDRKMQMLFSEKVKSQIFER